MPERQTERETHSKLMSLFRCVFGFMSLSWCATPCDVMRCDAKRCHVAIMLVAVLWQHDEMPRQSHTCTHTHGHSLKSHKWYGTVTLRLPRKPFTACPMIIAKGNRHKAKCQRSASGLVLGRSFNMLIIIQAMNTCPGRKPQDLSNVQGMRILRTSRMWLSTQAVTASCSSSCDLSGLN